MVSKNLARCLAKISGDGELYKNYIRYNNKCEVLLEEFKKDLQIEFGKLHFTEGKVSSGTTFVHVTNKKVVNTLLEYNSSFKSNNIIIPKVIMLSSTEVKKEFIRAFYDDEGCASLRFNKKTNEWKRNVNLSSNSKLILEQVKYVLLTDFSIRTNRIIRNKREDSCFVLSITGKDNFLKFRDKISFLSPQKRNMLNLIIQSYESTYTRNKYGFEKLIKEISSVPCP